MQQRKAVRLRGRGLRESRRARRRPGLKGAALYNAGNAHWGDQRIDDAIEKYKAALRENPADPDAKHNLELAQQKRRNGKNPQDGDRKPEPREGRMSPEDAERLLQALTQRENEARHKANARRPQEPPAEMIGK
ncbi:MAG: hypothetical protein IPK56_11035 [Elusimicrobia bacterium]|nr:hypothetical protein [Elusimicrobiota bacterium]